jgi:3-oxoacyl-[acyl-carrier-protein] synthase III
MTVADQLLSTAPAAGRPAVLRLRADEQRGAGKLDEAIATLDEIVRRDPSSAAAPEALFHAASLLWSRDRDGEAKRRFVELRRRYPRDVNEAGWPALVRAVCEAQGLAPSAIDLFVFTQVRRTTIERVMSTLELPMERAHLVMDRFGYTGSACIPMALHDAITSGRARAGDRVVLVGSGVGLNQAAVVLELTDDLVDVSTEVIA